MLSVEGYDFCPRLLGGEFSCVSFKKFCSVICKCPVPSLSSLLADPLPHTHMRSALLDKHISVKLLRLLSLCVVVVGALPQSASISRNINAEW
jgi:hypothetical protein